MPTRSTCSSSETPTPTSSSARSPNRSPSASANSSSTPGRSPSAAPPRSWPAGPPGSVCGSPSRAGSATTTRAAYVRDALTARGVDTRALRLDPDLPTPLTVVLTRGRRPRHPHRAGHPDRHQRRRRARRSCWPPPGTCTPASYFLHARGSPPTCPSCSRPPATTAPRPPWTPATTPPGAGTGPPSTPSSPRPTSCCPTRREAVQLAGPPHRHPGAAAALLAGPRPADVVVKNGARRRPVPRRPHPAHRTGHRRRRPRTRSAPGTASTPGSSPPS